MSEYNVILYYKYINIFDPIKEIEQHKIFLKNKLLLGRIILSEEGINGTLCGTYEECEKYIEFLRESQYFYDIEIKKSKSNFVCFEKLKIKYKKEIAYLGIDPKILSAKDSTNKITSEELHFEIENKKDIILIDVRNYYEWKIGRFQSENIKIILPNLQYFRTFPEYLEKNKNLFKDKDIVMYCTGGVRCERTSALLNKMNIAKQVRHLDNGIHRYIEKFPNGFFRGKNYTFDNRISIKANDDILSNCELCNIAYDMYNNCLNAICNKHYICCNICIKIYHKCCSEKCIELTKSKLVPIRKLIPSRMEFA